MLMNSDQKAWAALAAFVLVLIILHFASTAGDPPECIPQQMECQPPTDPDGGQGP